MAADHTDLESYVRAGTYIGWTNGDMRTLELKDQLGPLLEAMHAYATAGRVGPLPHGAPAQACALPLASDDATSPGLARTTRSVAH